MSSRVAPRNLTTIATIFIARNPFSQVKLQLANILSPQERVIPKRKHSSALTRSFQPAPPCRERVHQHTSPNSLYQPARTPLVGSDFGRARRLPSLLISTRTPLAGSDSTILYRCIILLNIWYQLINNSRLTGSSSSYATQNSVRTSHVNTDFLAFAPHSYNAKNPSASYVCFAPTCSILV